MTITRMTNEIFLVEFNTKVFEHWIPNIYAKYVIFCYFFFKSCSSFTVHLDYMVSLETCLNKAYMLEIKWCNPSNSKRFKGNHAITFEDLWKGISWRTKIQALKIKGNHVFTFEEALVKEQKFNTLKRLKGIMLLPLRKHWSKNKKISISLRSFLDFVFSHDVHLLVFWIILTLWFVLMFLIFLG